MFTMTALRKSSRSQIHVLNARCDHYKNMLVVARGRFCRRSACYVGRRDTLARESCRARSTFSERGACGLVGADWNSIWSGVRCFVQTSLGEAATLHPKRRQVEFKAHRAVQMSTREEPMKLAMETSHRAAVLCFNIVGSARSHPARCYCYA
jgi:hypothetical protein